MPEYSELETIYRALHAFPLRRNRWDEHPGDKPLPPPTERPIFSGRRLKDRSPDPPLKPDVPFMYTDPTKKMPRAWGVPDKIREILERGCPQLEPYKLAAPDLPIEFELVDSPSALRDSDFEACFQLVKQTSSNDYKCSNIGWKPKAKKEEMRHPDMIYLLIRMAGASENNDEPKDILGFLSFMFTYDDPPHAEREVIYIYEIHLVEDLRGRGLGTILIQFLEFVTLECCITKTMLTVFKVNEPARNLYSRLGYTKDACSPEDKVVRRRIIEADYIIMSKDLVHRL